MAVSKDRLNRLFFLWFIARALVFILPLTLVGAAASRLNGGLGIAIAMVAGLLEARQKRDLEIEAEHFVANWGNSADQLTVIQETVPADEPVTVIGTLEYGPPGLSGRRWRWAA